MTEFVHARQVEFYETDMAGIVHFSNYYRYMESAEHAFLRSLGVPIHPPTVGGSIGWPRVQASCEFKSPLRYLDRFEIVVRVQELRSRSITYEFLFRKVGGDAPVEIARGRMTSVHVKIAADGTMTAAPLPPELTDALRGDRGAP